MNWNSELYEIEEWPLFKDAVAIEQCNWPGGLPEYKKPSISFYNVFENEDFSNRNTVAIWRKKQQPCK